MDTTASTGESSYEARLRTGPKGTAVSGKPAVSEGTFPRARGGRGILELLPARARGDSTLPVTFAACLGLGSLLSLIGSALSINSPVPFIFAPPASAILRLIGSVFFAAAGLLAPALAAVIKSALTQAAVPRFMPRGLARLSERAWPALVGGAGFCLLAANILSTVSGYRARQSLIGHLTSGGKVSTYVPDAVLEKLGGGKAATAASGVLFGSMPLHVAQEALWRVGVVLLAAGLTLKAVYTIPALAPVQWKRVVGKGGLLPGWRDSRRAVWVVARKLPRRSRWAFAWLSLTEGYAGWLGLLGSIVTPLAAATLTVVPLGGLLAAFVHYVHHGSIGWGARLQLLLEHGDVGAGSTSKAEAALAMGLLPGPGIWLTACHGALLLGVLCSLGSWLLAHAIAVTGRRVAWRGAVADVGLLGLPRPWRRGR